MKSQSSKIRSHMVRGARINDQIKRGTKIRVMDYSVSIGYSEGRGRSLGKGGGREARVEVER